MLPVAEARARGFVFACPLPAISDGVLRSLHSESLPASGARMSNYLDACRSSLGRAKRICNSGTFADELLIADTNIFAVWPISNNSLSIGRPQPWHMPSSSLLFGASSCCLRWPKLEHEGIFSFCMSIPIAIGWCTSDLAQWIVPGSGARRCLTMLVHVDRLWVSRVAPRLSAPHLREPRMTISSMEVPSANGHTDNRTIYPNNRNGARHNFQIIVNRQ